MLIVKPTHNKYAFTGPTNTQYANRSLEQSKWKKYDLRSIFSFASGAGVISVAKDVATGNLINSGKRKFAAIAITGALYVFSHAVMVFTNSRNVIKWAGKVYSTSAFIFECVEDSSNLVFLPFDLVLFGQLISIGISNRFNLFHNYTNFMA